jgi:hypothetical protein
MIPWAFERVIITDGLAVIANPIRNVLPSYCSPVWVSTHTLEDTLMSD